MTGSTAVKTLDQFMNPQKKNLYVQSYDRLILQNNIYHTLSIGVFTSVSG